MKYEREIFATYNKKCIRIYQAYNSSIAKEAIKLQTFGEHFNRNRMTWIKPSFLWMMYRSNWGSKKDQENILALDIYVEKFDELLSSAVLTSPDSSLYAEPYQWEKAFESTEVYCQWDPDKNIDGNPIYRAAIQIGIKGNVLEDFLKHGIYRIEDLTPQVIKWREQRKQGKFNPKNLPVEKIYTVTDKDTRKRLCM